MAAVAAPVSAIDLKAPSSYPIRLGASILRPAESKTYSSVRYNHKPRRKGDNKTTSSIDAPEDDGVRLSLQNGSEEYGYEGRAVDNADRYVLLTRGNGKDKELVLEKLNVSHDFNLTSTPNEKTASKLAERYQQLQAGDEEGGLFGDDEEIDEPADANNPFDFRNHLQAESAKSRPNGADTPRSAAATPRAAQRAATSTPLAQPKRPTANIAAVAKKRKPQDPLKPNPKRVKAGTEPPATTSSRPKPKDVPSVRIDRKASVRRPSFDLDSGELILENETPVTEKPPRAPGAMALALSGQLGQGPISLRSAASSPASRDASPMPPRPAGIESPVEFEMGESSPETSAKAPRGKQTEEDYFSNAGEEDVEDADADADVEDLELPSPRQRRKNTLNAGGGGGDEDFDMERALELALAQDDGAVVQPMVGNESDEESEEE